MTLKEKMQKIVEAAGECWHTWRQCGYLPQAATTGYQCIKCKEEVVVIHSWESAPEYVSPTDLNELFRLAEKLDARFVVRRLSNGVYVAILRYHNQDGFGTWAADTPAEALLDALYQSVEGDS